MSWYFRAVQTPNETWLCRWGKQDYDEHVSLADAVEHLTQLAETHQPAELFVHWLGGAVTRQDWPEPGSAPTPG